jgi:hypothetical protein
MQLVKPDDLIIQAPIDKAKVIINQITVTIIQGDTQWLHM